MRFQPLAVENDFVDIVDAAKASDTFEISDFFFAVE
jgi:hypothetical protein